MITKSGPHRRALWHFYGSMTVFKKKLGFTPKLVKKRKDEIA